MGYGTPYPERGKGFTQPPLCPFCSAPWTEDMVKVLNVSASEGCDSCGFDAVVSATVDITCESCGRLIYRKEYSN